ncbi:MAG TPA: cellulose synthase subunit BcsC-related outer membrane protein [Bryobacteraceae bacterium]|nr:cellulose synthase subunit BcsC-related outer membrane protein [Bryobacteraceae bacterium]
MKVQGLISIFLTLFLTFQALAQPVDPALLPLFQKARALEGRGRLDLAVKAWQQVLWSDPKNTEALGALARLSKQTGEEGLAKAYLERLRRLAPNAAIPEPPRTAARDARFRTAESLAQAGRYEESAKAYEQILGKETPTGTVAVEYYETVAGVKGRTAEALAGLERLLRTEPNRAEYILALGRVSTYQPQTRARGIRLLQSIPAGSPQSAKARQALRQALVWENGSPSSLPALREMLTQNPDAELTKLADAASAAVTKPLAQSPQEALGYEALNAGKVDAAVTHFEKALRETPRSMTAHAGQAYARMKQRDWAGAVSAWDQALRLGPANKQYAAAQAESRYFLAMEEGTNALAQDRTASAVTSFRAALALRPTSIDAQRGLAGALMAGGEDKAAAAIFATLTAGSSSTSGDWRNLIAARAKSGGQKEALALWAKAPEEVRTALRADSELQLLLAGAFLNEGQATEAAAGYQSVVAADAGNVVAWEGLIAALMATKEETKAYEALSSMPAKVYAEAVDRPGFLRSASLLQMHLGRYDVVESLLLKWIAREGSDKVPADIKTQLATIWLRQGKAAEAEKLLRELLAKDANNVEATRQLLAALQTQRRSAEALLESKRMPPIVQAQLQQDSDYLTLIAAINSDAGNQGEALRLVRETLSRFEAKGEKPPAPLRLQQAWLLLNANADGRELFSVLRTLSSDASLTADQRTSYMELWSVWAQRQAEEARRSGKLDRASAILAEAAKMLPADARIRSAYAGSLMEAGETKKALAAYKQWGLTGATPADYSAAIGAAMAEKSELTNRWMDEAMKRFPANPQVLGLAADLYAQKGDYARAETYYRSALALADRKPRAERAPLFAGREPGNALGRLIVGEQSEQEKEGDPDAERLGRVLSGERSADTLPVAGFTNALAAQKSESDRIAERLRAITSRNTPSFDVTTSVSSRSGTPGFDRRTLQETEIGASTVLGNSIRATLIVRPTSVRTEASDGSSETFRLGLLPATSTFDAQSVSGLAAEFQLSGNDFGLRVGASPQGFLVKNYVGGIRYRPGGGPVTFLVSRDNVKDSLLSFAGRQDPITKQIWGGVVSNLAQVTGNWGTEQSGFYLSGGYAVVTGQNVQTNRAFNGNGGNYWRVLHNTNGALTVGLNMTGLAYEKNLRYYTSGQGGYFSPQRFYMFNVPLTWRGSYGQRFRYVVSGGLGTQHFREDRSAYFPTLPDLQNAVALFYPGQSQTGASYSVDFRGIYQLSEQWFMESFVNINNARNFTAQSAGFTVKYGFRPRPIGTEPGPPSVPDWKGAQPFLP